MTLYVRNKIVDALNDTLPNLFQVILQCYDLMCGKAPEEYDPSVKFGEYASPDFDSTVDTIGKAKQFGVMSLETSVEQLYGDTWTQDEKDAEVERLKAEQGIVQLEEPGVNQTTGDFAIDFGGEKNAGKVSRPRYRSRNEFEGPLKVASEQVPFGIYAVEHEKNGYAELRCDRCKSITQLKNLTRQFKSRGFKVYANGGNYYGYTRIHATITGFLRLLR